MQEEQVKYILHEDPVGMGAHNFIANANLARYGFPGLMEQVWLKPLEDGQYEVRCIPFRVYGLALFDRVVLDAENRLKEVASRSGHRCRRVLFPEWDTAQEGAEMVSSISAAISSRGLLYEWSGNRHLAIDVPPGNSQVDEIERVIRLGVQARVAETYWEWGDSVDFQGVQ
ncbi:DUF4265 domain-containing protein [Streptomyces sp. NPDC002520]